MNKQIGANLKSKPMSTILDSIPCRRLRFHVSAHTQPQFIRLRLDSSKAKKKHQIGKRKGREISTLCHTCFSFLHQKFPDLQDHSLGECSSSSSIFEMSEKFSIFLASSGSFTVNDNIHRFFFFAVQWLPILNLPASRSKRKIHTLDHFHGNSTAKS